MTHYAKVENGIVTQVIVADADFINSGYVGNPASWLQTSYNTQGNVHLLGGTPFRKNYAGVGYTYDPTLDAFIPPKLFNSWLLNEDTGLWDAPIIKPDDGVYYIWNENILNWQEVENILPPTVEGENP